MRAVLHFEVDRLYVTSDARGLKLPLFFEGKALTIELPSAATAFGMKGWPDEHATWGFWDKGDQDTDAVLVLRVEVDCGAHPLRASAMNAEKPQPPAERRLMHDAQTILDTVADLAKRAVARFLAIVRTDGGQYWLGTSHVLPATTWLSTLLDDEGARFPIGVGMHHVMAGFSIDDAVSADDLKRFASQVGIDEDVESSMLLLADAQQELMPDRPNDTRRAVLFAAIAAETMVKRALRAAADDRQRELVEALLNNPRDYSMMAAALFDKAAEPVFGVSLRKLDKKLYGRVEKLFTVRNKLAHKDEKPTTEQARESVATAAEAIEWLRAVGRPFGARAPEASDGNR